MPRAPALLCVMSAFACAASGCTSQSRTVGTAAMVGGTAAAIAGGALFMELKSPGDDSDGNGVDDFPENDIACAIGGCLLAIGLVAAGLATAGAGVAVLARGDDPPPPPLLPLPVTPPPSGPPGETAEIDLRLVAPLPNVPCDAMTLQFAKQARRAARRGDCDIARMITRRIAERDRQYAAALRTSPALARCR